MYTLARTAIPRASVVVGALACLAPLPLAAQGASWGRIEGQVVDSLRGRGAAGATVMAIRLATDTPLFRSTVADARGQYRLDSLAAGHYAVSFTTPLLDSLSLVLPDREIDVAAGARVELALGVPSSATLRAAACPGLLFEPGRGAVVGSVVDASTDRPLPGATVVVAWVDLVIDPGTVQARTTPRTASVTADSTGAYRLCGVPTDSPIELQVQRGGASSGIIEAMVSDSIGMLRHNLSFSVDAGSPAAADTALSATTAVRTDTAAATGTATAAGTVTDVDGRPMADVEVRVAGARGTSRSDAAGRFTLVSQPAGTRMLEARRIGYEVARTSVELRAGRTTTQDVRLSRVVTLDSIRIIAQRSRYKEFEQRRRNSFGRFFNEADLLRRNPYNTSDVFRTMPGFAVVRNGFDAVLVSSRGYSSFRGATCRTNVVVDGMPDADIDMVHPADIGAMEVYSGPSGAPPQYKSTCGLVIIWTKR